MPSVIAFDFDGTIADTGTVKAGWVLRTFGRRVEPWNCSRGRFGQLGLREGIYDTMLGHSCSLDGTLSARPCKGSIAALRSLSRQAELWILSDRGANDEWRDAALAWMDAHGVRRLFSNFIWSTHETPKPDVCRKTGVDILADDDPTKMRCLRPPTYGILYLGGGPQLPRTPHRIRLAGSWGDVVTLCKGILPAENR